MKSGFVAAFLLSASSGVVFAQDIQAQSHIDSVTIYPQGADIVRLAKTDLVAGEDMVIFSELPADVDPQSIRVEGSGAERFDIGSIDTKLQSINDTAGGERKGLDRKSVV